MVSPLTPLLGQLLLKTDFGRHFKGPDIAWLPEGPWTLVQDFHELLGLLGPRGRLGLVWPS